MLFINGWTLKFLLMNRGLKAAYGVLLLGVLIGIFNVLLCNEKPIIAKTNHALIFPAVDEWMNDWGISNASTKIDKMEYEWALYPLIKYSYDFIDPSIVGYKRPMTKGQNGRHWLGTDNLGRDVLAGICRGFYVAFKIGLISLLIIIAIGVGIGLILGYYGDHGLRFNVFQYLSIVIGIFLISFYTLYPLVENELLGVVLIIFLIMTFWRITKALRKIKGQKFDFPLDSLGLKVIELLKSIPSIIFLLALLPLFKSPSLLNLVFVLSFLYWKNMARHVRAETLSIKQKSFVESARAQGQGDLRILIKQILPNVLPTILVLSGFVFTGIVLLESSLSFLGIGLPIGEVSWGSLLSEGRRYYQAWWLSIFPGICIFVVLLSLNAIVDKKILLK